MNIKRSPFWLSTLVVIIFAALSSCSKTDDGPGYSYFVSKELAISYNRGYINSLLDVVAGSVPEVSSLKPLVVSDVNVYKIIYKTTINGNQIEASGLVSVPSTPGDYPVLSFQNGTNTVNAYSPSEFAINYPYQLVEILASMGYIVVMADYPGFGESYNIPHPYLVAEPTVSSLIDMLYAVKELSVSELDGITLINDYYLLGYSQGGWATLELHKAIEQDFSNDFNLKGSVCGAGPYNIFLLMQGMLNSTTYPMPIYIGYIINAYTAYGQFTNPVTDILNEPYASRLSSLYNGILDSDEINARLTTSLSGLITPGFLSGFASSAKYTTVREALSRNSIAPWKSVKPLLLIHGEKDTSVNPSATETMYTAMIQAGTSVDICKKVIIPGVGHGDGIAPCMIQGILFLNNLRHSK
jgi:pimeloyl-ACP methyl ester carboxylesterase